MMNVCVCLSVGMFVREYISETTGPNFIDVAVQVACDCVSVLLCGGVTMCCVLPVLWMTSSVLIMGHMVQTTQVGCKVQVTRSSIRPRTESDIYDCLF